MPKGFLIIPLFGLAQAQAFTITLDSNNFGVSPVFSSVTSFIFVIEVDEPFLPGTTYSNPTLSLLDYTIGGALASGTPSGFPAFLLDRTMDGTEFYAQGSSLNFTIGAGADLSDGLQMSELTGTDPVFILNAREFNTGRYHPTLFELYSNGTGVVQNSNNSGPTTTNPATGQLVNVNFGEEYISNLTFNPATATIGVPEPSSALLLLSGFAMLRRSRR
jgi:hypothetical protein